MSDIEPYRGNGLATKASRQASRELSRIEAIGSVRQARVEMAAEVQAATVDAVTYVGRRAMQDMAMLSQAELQLAQAVPLAGSRLKAIGNLTALALGEVVADTVTRLRQR